MTDYRKEPKSELAWGYYNWGRLWGIEFRRRDAIATVERITGEPWAKAKRYCEIHRVRVERHAP